MTAPRPRFPSAADHVRQNACEVATDRVLALLDRGTVPWRRSWVEPVAAAERILDGMPDPPTIKVAGLRRLPTPVY